MSSPEYRSSPYTQEEVEAAFIFWSHNLAGRTNGEFEAVDVNDPEQFAARSEFIDLNTAFYPAAEMGSSPDGHERLKSLLHKIADNILEPGEFGGMVEAFRNKPGFLSQTRELWESGENTANVTNHNRIIDLAILQSAKYCSVDRPGFAEDSVIIVSKTLGYMDVILETDEQGDALVKLPAIQVMQTVSNVLCSVPRSKKSLEHPELQSLNRFGDDFNRKLIPLLRDVSRNGGSDLTISASASVDEYDPYAQTIAMKRVEPIVAKLISRYYPNVAPIPMYVNQDRRLRFDIGNLRRINEPEQIHELMSEMVGPYQKFVGSSATVRYSS